MNMAIFEPFVCESCGGCVELRSGQDRKYEFERGFPPMPIPADIKIPTCSDCEEMYVLPEQTPMLRAALKLEFTKWQSDHMAQLVALLVGTHGATKRQVAGVLGVTPSHLSHILAGTDLASVTLIRFTESLVHSGTEFRRILRGTPCKVPTQRFDIYRCVEISYLSANDDLVLPENFVTSNELREMPHGYFQVAG